MRVGSVAVIGKSQNQTEHNDLVKKTKQINSSFLARSFSQMSLCDWRLFMDNLSAWMWTLGMSYQKSRCHMLCNYISDCARLHGAVKDSKFRSQQFGSGFIIFFLLFNLCNFGFFSSSTLHLSNLICKMGLIKRLHKAHKDDKK